MAGLDVAAGVVSLAGAGIAVAKGLVQIADGIGSAGEEVGLCASDIALFSRMLENLGDALRFPTATSRATQRTTEDLIEIFGTSYTAFPKSHRPPHAALSEIQGK